MASTMHKATEQDTESHFFGSGFDSFEWWGQLTREWEYDRMWDAPNGWVWTVRILDPETERKFLRKDVDHKAVMRAARKISRNEIKGVSKDCRDECLNLLFDPDAVAFDACTADEVMQAVMLGEVVYG